MKNLLLLSVIACLSFACGNKDEEAPGIPGEGLPELTDSQRIRVRGVSDSVSEVQQMTDEQMPQEQRSHLIFGSRKLRNAGQMKGKLNKAIDNKNCDKIVVNTPQTESNQQFKVGLQINGEKCPILFSTLQEGIEQEQGQEISSSEHYKAFEGRGIYEETDVHAYDLEGRNSTLYQPQTKVSGTVVISQDYNGVIQSKTDGAITVSLKINGTLAYLVQDQQDPTNKQNLQQKGQMTGVTDLRFADFQVIGYTTMNVEDPSSERFYINGRQSSREEYEKLFGSLEEAESADPQ